MSTTNKRLRSQANQQLTSTTKSSAKSTSPVKSSIAGGRQKAVTGPAKLPITPNKQPRSPSAPHTKTKPEALRAGAACRLPRPAASKPSLPGLTKRQTPAGSKPLRCSTKLLPADASAAPQAVNSAPAPDKRAVDSDPTADKRFVFPPELPPLQDLRQKLQVSRHCLSAACIRQSLLGKSICHAAFVYNVAVPTPAYSQWSCTACVALMLPLLRRFRASLCAMPFSCFCQRICTVVFRSLPTTTSR